MFETVITPSRPKAIQWAEYEVYDFDSCPIILLLLSFFFQKFLNEYGYVSFSRSGNHDVSTAIRMFQEYFGLRVSGILDASTVNLMKKPRCGVPDANEGVRMQRYATLGKWSKKNLNYFVQPGQDLPHVSYKRIVLFYFILFYFFFLPQ